MKKLAAVGAVLLLGTSAAMAQIVIDIGPDDERTVYSTITRERVVRPSVEFDVNVGAVVPREVELYEVPDTIEVEPVRRYRYVVMDGRVVLVDPSTRRVVRVIRR
jgi:hypothetical protein